MISPKFNGVQAAPEATSPWLAAILRCTRMALAAGALQPADVRHEILEHEGLRFILRIPQTPAPPPGGPRDPDFNPFLPPDPQLTVGPVGDAHVLILNKFPVCEHHVVLARTAFFEQQSALERSDFAAMAVLLGEAGGLGFYNGGSQAGASQRHKHVQWLPRGEHNPGLRSYTQVFSPELDEHTLVRHPALPFAHRFVRVLAGQGRPVLESAASLHQASQRALAALGLRANASGLLPAFNLLVEEGWMLVVPRRQEHCHGISFNALSFGGLLQLAHADQVERVRAAGPLALLAATAFAVSGEGA